MDIGHVLFRVQGRIGQQDFWIGVLIILGAHFIGSTFLSFLMPLLWLALVWVGIAVYGKRLHDAGRSAWIHAIPWAIWLALFIVGTLFLVGAGIHGIFLGIDGNDPSASDVFSMIATGGIGLAVYGLSYLVWMVYTVWVGLLPSDEGENAYGSAPGGDGGTAANASAAAASAGPPLASEGTTTDDTPKS